MSGESKRLWLCINKDNKPLLIEFNLTFNLTGFDKLGVHEKGALVSKCVKGEPPQGGLGAYSSEKYLNTEAATLVLVAPSGLKFKGKA